MMGDKIADSSCDIYNIDLLLYKTASFLTNYVYNIEYLYY